MRLLPAAVLAISLAGCGTNTTPSPTAASSSTPTATFAGQMSPAPTLTIEPSSNPTSPSASPTGSASPDSTPSLSDPAAACSGTDKNQGFFATFAASVTWDVYCAVLPDGWYIQSGSYHLRDGGELDVSYKGPAGASLELQEGSFCTAGASACAPHDQWIGGASFGNRQGQVATLDGGSTLAIYVSPGERPGWQATAMGLDRQAFMEIVAALAIVAR